MITKIIEIRKIGIDRYWQTAGDRVFLYLRCLNFPAAQAFELVLRALNEAEQNILKKDLKDNPVAEAMQALHELLSKRQYQMLSGRNLVSLWCEQEWMKDDEARNMSFSPESSESGACIESMPDLRRCHMTPQELSRPNLHALFGYFTRGFKKYPRKVK